MVWSEGGRESRAHSLKLVVTRVLTVARVLVVARVRSWPLAVIREPWWPFWLVVGRVGRGSWAMVERAGRWVVVAACGQWMVAGDRSRAAGGRRSWGVICGPWWLVVVVFGRGGGGGLFLHAGGRFREQK